MSMCGNYNACTIPAPVPDCPKKNLDTRKLGGSGISSSRRSAVTKSYLRSTQAGFDDHGDASSGVHGIVQVASSRPGAVASILASTMGGNKNQDEEKKTRKFLCVPITNNVKALFVMMILFAIISIAQYFAAVAANSQSLKADVVSMGVDALTYLGNICGESSDIPARRTVLQLIFSFVSLLVLTWVNTNVLIESLDIFKTSKEQMDEGAEDGEGVIAGYVLGFALGGLVFDAICLYAFYHYASKDAEEEYQEMLLQAKAAGRNTDEITHNIKKPQVNMLSALLHVSADLMRSTTTFIEGILLMVDSTFTPARQSYVDAICGILICAIIYVGALYALYEWIGSFYKWFLSLGQDIVIYIPELDRHFVVKPEKCGGGRVADTVLG